jgi:hypothetical protein
MKKKGLYLSIGAAVLLILASLTSVIGFSTTHSQDQQNSVDSPLFTVRVKRSIGQTADSLLKTTYLGKGRTSHLFLSKISSTQSIIERGLQLLKTAPGLIEKSLRKTLQDHQIQKTLRENGMSEQQVLQYFNQAKSNPELFADEFVNVAGLIPSDNGPKPLGLLNTTSVLACLITAVILLPIFLVIGLIIATITIITCLNVNNCFNDLMDNILQGLRSP